MSRREIRRLLMEPKRRSSSSRSWAVLALMAAVLLGGIAIGAGVGLGIMASRPDQEARDWERAEMAVDRPPRREALLEPAAAAEPPVIPLVPLPPARPGGPADDGFDADQASGQVADQQVASVPLILPQPSVKPVEQGAPAWVRYAVPAPKAGSQPMIAVVIDDLGVDRKRSEKVVELRAPLTLAWMTYAENLPQITQLARKRGHELMVHVPMQPQGESYDPGPDVLEVAVHPEENRRRLAWGLNRFEGFVGINNHMGSRFTADRTGMKVVMEEVKRRGLLFLDSVTTDKSVAPELAKRHGVPFAARSVFLDNEQSVASVKAQLAKTEAHARKFGAAIAIGHPHDATIEALAAWLPGLEARGFLLVPVTTIVKAQTPP
ncbi:divergent polysaccharide deacetylase family protein [Magnetospirillum moscoviense]|uniref:Divergent polysaccharide deacetylase family protein n=1 Tax=Magnetospirillum moscoviense TaxID=1437059 RepID=A0A178N175_9PROT|nr:divergent polysaccharide deacetylase family protein [Magnetospirillum moscoviense]OAN64488.1 hypothetical protein A6A05_06290 [Magnetospirillum moscoviense]